MEGLDVIKGFSWGTNSELIEDCFRLGYVRGCTLDPTYGLGSFWSKLSFNALTEFIGTDINAEKSDPKYGPVDFTALPFYDNRFNTVVFDPPYKLNGTEAMYVADDRYGVTDYVPIKVRYKLIKDGMRECARVVAADGHLLVKCQDQVANNRVYWQSLDFANFGAKRLGLKLVDRLDFLSYRPQPPNVRQVHVRRNYSTLLVFRKP